MTTRLSILIPAIPSRFEMAQKLYSKILEMTKEMYVEILLLVDNKKRTIGEKREALKNICNGEYFMFCDEDDDLLSIKEVYEATNENVDVITFEQRCFNPNGKEFIVTFGLGNEVEHNTDGNGNYIDSLRPPFHVCAWNKRFKEVPFPDISYGEDWEWVKRALERAKTEIHIPKVIHSYNYRPEISEADSTTNNYWKNPNDLPVAKRAIVNLATGETYINAQKRLKESLVDKFDGDCFFFTSEKEVGAPLHKDDPYAFKIYAIEKVRELGYNQILWLDASLVAVKDVSPVFDWMTEKGIFMEEAGHYAGSWTNNNTLKYFDLTREDAMKMPMFSAGFCGMDFRQGVSKEFFAEWKESMLNGCFKGEWKDHRHDMSAGSIIANKHGLNKLYSHGGQFFAYIGPGYEKPLDTVVFHLLGV